MRLFSQKLKVWGSLLFILFVSMISEPFAQTDSLTYLMHAFVKIKTKAGIVIYIDPALVSSFEDSADVVLITHEHGDHNDLSRLRRKPECVTIRAADAVKSGVHQSFAIGDITIKAVPAYNGNHSRNNSVGYVVGFDSIKIYHAGDTGKIDEMADLAAENITYALLPMDGTYTMTPEAATEAAEMINAKFDMPIHTLGGISGYSDVMVARFTSPNKLVVRPGSTIALTNTTTSIDSKESNPQSFNLYQNYPNPFNPETLINYYLPVAAKVQLQVFDMLGREVAELINSEKETGEYSLRFNASHLSSGIYFYRLTVNSVKANYIQTMKMTLLR